MATKAELQKELLESRELNLIRGHEIKQLNKSIDLIKQELEWSVCKRTAITEACDEAARMIEIELETNHPPEERSPNGARIALPETRERRWLMALRRQVTVHRLAAEELHPNPSPERNRSND